VKNRTSIVFCVAAFVLSGSFVLRPASGVEGAAPTNPSLRIRALFEQSRQLLRTQRGAEAVPLLQQAVAQAETLPPGAPRAEAFSEAGLLLWSTRRLDLAESALRSAAQQMEGPPPSAVSPQTRSMTYRMLGVVLADQRRFDDAIPWFQRAVKTDEALPDSTPQLAGQKYFVMTSNLRSLSEAQCRAGGAAAAEASDQRRLEACARSPNPWSVGACRDGKRPCKDGWMQDGPAATYPRK
jgi:tetratricopeptide (TPR) repeat protein